MKRFLRNDIIFRLPARLKFQENLKVKNYYFQQKRTFNNQSDQNNNGEEEFEDSGESVRYFIPKNTMTFKNDLSLIYIFHQHHKTRRIFIGVLCLFGYLGYKSAEKLYNYHERSFLGGLFYAILGIYSLRLCKTAISQGSLLINKMSLCRDGTNVMIETYKYGIKPHTFKVDIGLISRETDKLEEMFVGRSFGMKIIVDNQDLTLAKHGEIINEEILRAVVNGYYIQIDPNRIVNE